MPEQFPQPNKSQEILCKDVEAFLTLPQRIEINNPDKDLSKNLGNFLVKKGYINEIKLWNRSWGFKYEDKKIYIAENEMSEENYNYYIFRLGVNSTNGECLFPRQGDESNQYRFLHETNHAYQDYLVHKESLESNIPSSSWYDKAVSGELDSNFALLFQFCYENRKKNITEGLSTWGNVPDYNSINHVASQTAIRAIEDANEMITMFIWHPEYLDAFLNYVSLNTHGYTEADLKKDCLTKLSVDKIKALKDLLELYIEEMKSSIATNGIKS